METKRICLRCKKIYPRDEIVCEECGERLADVTSDFEASFSMVRDPVLLSNGHDADTMYLREALRERNVPFYIEEGENAVPTSHYKEGIVEIVPFINIYVDKSNWRMAKDALLHAREETRKDGEAPVVFLDMPEQEPGDELEAHDLEEQGGRRGKAGNPWSWYQGLDMSARVLLGGVAGVFLLGLVAILLS